MSWGALRSAAKGAPEVEEHVRAGTKAFPRETDQAASALGGGWTTAGAMEQLSGEWLRALRRLADEIDYLGTAVGKCADNRQWAEEETKQAITRIRTGGR